MSDTIDKVVMNAVSQISDLPGILSNVVKNKCFITLVNETYIEYGQKNENHLVIIDFTKKLPTDKEEYCRHSERLYNNLASIERWYRC